MSENWSYLIRGFWFVMWGRFAVISVGRTIGSGPCRGVEKEGQGLRSSDILGFRFLEGKIFHCWISYCKTVLVLFFKTVLLFMLLDQIFSSFHLSRINNDKFIAVKKNIRFNFESKGYSPTHLISTLPKRVNQNYFTENERIVNQSWEWLLDCSSVQTTICTDIKRWLI